MPKRKKKEVVEEKPVVVNGEEIPELGGKPDSLTALADAKRVIELCVQAFEGSLDQATARRLAKEYLAQN